MFDVMVFCVYSGVLWLEWKERDFGTHNFDIVRMDDWEAFCLYLADPC